MAITGQTLSSRQLERLPLGAKGAQSRSGGAGLILGLLWGRAGHPCG